MRSALAIGLLFVTLLGCSGSGKSAATAAPATAPDAANTTFVVEGKTITLVNGKAEETAAPGSASRNITTLTTFAATGDLDGDGKSDLAVVLTNSTGGSGNFYYLAALLSSGPLPSKTVLLGDRISVSDVSMKAGRITVSYLTRPDGVPFTATPSVPTSKTFGITGGQLTQN
jgi:hypothetical protein